jgi:hypothetical protein
MLLTLRIAIFLLLVYPALLFAGSSSREEWLPIAPEELKMTSEPKAPGAPAIYLCRQVDRDDIENREFIYARIKIFTEEGRKYANIELPFLKGAWDIKDIQARTIHPDGTILDFSSSIFEKTIVKAKGLKSGQDFHFVGSTDRFNHRVSLHPHHSITLRFALDPQ